jgi:hypothetical protein
MKALLRLFLCPSLHSHILVLTIQHVLLHSAVLVAQPLAAHGGPRVAVRGHGAHVLPLLSAQDRLFILRITKMANLLHQ